MTNRNNNSKTEPSGSIKAIMEEFPDAEIVNLGELYCQCKAKHSYGLICINCKKRVEITAAPIRVCNCEHGHNNCTCDGGQS